MKLLGVIRDSNYLEYLDNGLDGLILPLEKFSVDYFKYYSISDIKSDGQCHRCVFHGGAWRYGVGGCG